MSSKSKLGESLVCCGVGGSTRWYQQTKKTGMKSVLSTSTATLKRFYPSERKIWLVEMCCTYVIWHNYSIKEHL